MNYTPEHAAKAREILGRLLPHVAPRPEYDELLAILESSSRWHEAHEQFSKIRTRITVPAEREIEWTLDRLFAQVAENAAKTAYNCSGKSAPFDAASYDRMLTAEAEFLERYEKRANQAPEPTPPLVTIRACARLAPSGGVAHL